ncbi:hypothetical protein [Methylobacterium sp. 77]|uniref:hypothetical protein n=1 Tax=Methylobacterium sp. 77 TaxID=1101192 RepID=UPI00037C9510|nr:hypothetical protein [Methylobacterium sp. 77]
MRKTQRDALTDMMRAILAVGHCPDDIRLRASGLQMKLTLDEVGMGMGRPS